MSEDKCLKQNVSKPAEEQMASLEQNEEFLTFLILFQAGYLFFSGLRHIFLKAFIFIYYRDITTRMIELSAIYVA